MVIAAYGLDYKGAPSLHLCDTFTYLIEYDREQASGPGLQAN